MFINIFISTRSFVFLFVCVCLQAMRALSAVAAKKPASVARCNDDMEGLVSDSNRYNI